MVELASTWRIEQKGIDWVDDGERHGRPAGLFWPWTAANFSFFTVAYGVFVVGLGLDPWQGAICVLVGLALSYPIVGLVGLAGTRGGAPTMTLSRAAFGYHGNKLPTFFVYVSLVGWETVSVTLGALATRTILRRIDPALATTPMMLVGFLVTVALVMVVAIYGYDVILRVQKWITIVVAVAVVGYFVIIIPDLDFGTTSQAGGFAAVVGGVTLVIANGIGWTPGGADYSRYTKGSPKAVVWWTTIGGATAPAVLMLFGVLLTAGNPRLAAAAAADPIGAFAPALPTWFLIPFLLATILSVVSGAVFNLYSSGLNLLALGIRIPRWTAVTIDGVLMVIGGIYLIFVAPTFFAPVQSFLIVIGVVTAAWSAIFVTDLFLHRKAGYVRDALYTPRGVYGGFNVAGVVSIVLAIGVGLGLVTSADENIRAVLGYLLSPAAAAGSVGASNIGVAVAFVVGALAYGLLTTTLLRPAERSG